MLLLTAVEVERGPAAEDFARPVPRIIVQERTAAAPWLFVYADSPRIRRTPFPNGAIRILPNG